MTDNEARAVAPHSWASYCWHSESKLHQLSPYIGKLKSTIAADLIDTYTKRGDTVLDPFCGSGTIPLEAALRGRTPVALDQSAYAYVLSRGKLTPPTTVASGLSRLERALHLSRARRVDLRTVPQWVRAFYHPATLRPTLAFADECIARNDYFLLSCLLGILHHQRPGFLSFPSSHLVPYLRTRKFPRATFPEMYEPRELEPRMVKKVERALGDGSDLRSIRASGSRVRQGSVERARLGRKCDAIITSPPYMNALDYVRDNRLRLWFLDRRTGNYAPEPTDKLACFHNTMIGFARRIVPTLRTGGNCILVVGESVRRKRMSSHPARRVEEWLAEHAPNLRLEEVIEDQIPDVRRARRGVRGTKKELILVYSKTR